MNAMLERIAFIMISCGYALSLKRQDVESAIYLNIYEYNSIRIQSIAIRLQVFLPTEMQRVIGNKHTTIHSLIKSPLKYIAVSCCYLSDKVYLRLAGSLKSGHSLRCLLCVRLRSSNFSNNTDVEQSETETVLTRNSLRLSALVS